MLVDLLNGCGRLRTVTDGRDMHAKVYKRVRLVEIIRPGRGKQLFSASASKMFLQQLSLPQMWYQLNPAIRLDYCFHKFTHEIESATERVRVCASN